MLRFISVPLHIVAIFAEFLSINSARKDYPDYPDYADYADYPDRKLFFTDHGRAIISATEGYIDENTC